MMTTLFNPDVLLHLGLEASGGVALKCALGFCSHPEHAWRRKLTYPVYALFLYFSAILTVSLVG